MVSFNHLHHRHGNGLIKHKCYTEVFKFVFQMSQDMEQNEKNKKIKKNFTNSPPLS